VNLPPLILASASPRRSELLRSMGLEFQVLVGKATEVQPEHLSPVETCQINAYRKARAVAKMCPDALVLGADTLVCLGGNVYGKPTDLEDALRMLLDLQGQEHLVITGVCLVHQRAHRQSIFADITRVVFRPLTAESARTYLSKINPLDKAGAYAIQEHGEMIVESIEGSHSNVVGLPVERLGQEFAAWSGDNV
jgi:septum formation protein